MRGRRRPSPGPDRCPAWTAVLVAVGVLAALLIPAASAHGAVLAQDGEPGAAGTVQVIAQGVVELPPGDVLWRTVRARALPGPEAPFGERPLGFVLATTAPLLLVDRDTGEQSRLGRGEAALVRAGAVQQRRSLTADPASYLAIELVPADAPPPADGIVLQPGQPFAAPAGLRDLDLLSGRVAGDESVTIPDTGAKNVVLVTAGAVGVARPEGGGATLLAGEAASFDGALDISGAAGEAAEAAFVVALIGPEVPPPASAAPTAAVAPASTAEPDAGPATATSAVDTGAIEVQVFTCPPGMTAETIAVAVCAPAVGDFDVTLSGGSLAAPLTLADATGVDGASAWDDLPFGEYLIAEAVPPAGYETYVLAAEGATGDAARGYRVTLGPETPRLLVRIYNLTAG